MSVMIDNSSVKSWLCEMFTWILNLLVERCCRPKMQSSSRNSGSSLLLFPCLDNLSNLLQNKRLVPFIKIINACLNEYSNFIFNLLRASNEINCSLVSLFVDIRLRIECLHALSTNSLGVRGFSIRHDWVAKHLEDWQKWTSLKLRCDCIIHSANCDLVGICIKVFGCVHWDPEDLSIKNCITWFPILVFNS